MAACSQTQTGQAFLRTCISGLTYSVWPSSIGRAVKDFFMFHCSSLPDIIIHDVSFNTEMHIAVLV